MAMNPQNAWQVHELAPGLVAALGCNGRGLAIATTLGRDLAAWFCGAGADELAIPPSAPRSIRLHRMREPLVRSLVAYYRLRDALETRR